MSAALMADCTLRFCTQAVEVDPLPPERLLAWGPGPVAAFVAPQGQAWVGVGAARWLPAGRFDSASLWAGLLDESSEAPPPVALGALPFCTDETPDALWQGLLPGGVMLPEGQYLQQGGRAWWRVVVPTADEATLPARLAQGRRALAALPHAEAHRVAPWQHEPDAASGPDYVRAVTEAVQRIGRGDLVKVVLSRRGAVVFDTAPEPAALLARLGRRHPDCIRYAWRKGARTWLGATPETLVRVDGQKLSTLALAGTRPAEQADELLSSAKDLHEHAVVVDAIRRAIAPHACALPAPAAPGIRRLRGLAHLQTPIEARLRVGTDLLRLVQALHPTPAVCGLPAAVAATLLRALEGQPRGLYAGPFVRLSPDGSGHAVVSLRGAVVDGCRAVLPAGAGIVAGSDGDAELAETQVKQASVLDAFQDDA